VERCRSGHFMNVLASPDASRPIYPRDESHFGTFWVCRTQYSVGFFTEIAVGVSL